MLFNSYFFIIVFLPTLLVLYFVAGRVFDNTKVAMAILVAASIVFYAFTRTDMCLFLVTNIIVNYLLVEWVHRTKSRIVLAVSIALNFGLLCMTKYLGMAMSLLNIILRTNYDVVELYAPLGISFITFQQIALLVYVYQSNIKQGLLEHSFIVSFFPHIAQGPILDPASFWEKNMGKPIQKLSLANISSGALLFVIGLSKKTLLADVYGRMVDAAYMNLQELNAISALFVSLAYTLQIYFDFSGYCDMAMGIGRLFNVELPLNFNSPYKAVTIDEFWDRWHITLTRFFTKYVYIPLGGNRKGVVNTLTNIMIVFLLSGLWHGASLTFVLWGGLHGLFMVISRLGRSVFSKIPKVISQIITFGFVNFAWVFFRAGTFTNLRGMALAFTVGGGFLTRKVTDTFDKIGVISIPVSLRGVGAWMFLVIGLFIVLVPKNAIEIAKGCTWKVTGAVVAAVLFLVCLFSFTGTTQYIYLSF